MELFCQKYEMIPCHVIEYCSKSLHTLFIRMYSRPFQCIIESTENPFTNLKKIDIRRCGHQSNLWTFDSAVFPNLQTLKFKLNKLARGIDFISPKMVYRIKTLKSFSFDDTMAQYNDKRIYMDIIDMIEMNTQLEVFEIALLEQFDEDSFGALMRHLACLPNLRRLNLICSGPESVFTVLRPYHFDTVTDFGLFNIPSTFATVIPFTFNQLKRFTISTANRSRTEHLNHPQIWDFIVNNKHLKSIFLHGRLNGSFITNYEHVFSQVEELYIHRCQDIPFDTVLGFIKNRLKKWKISGTRESKRNKDDIFDMIVSNGFSLTRCTSDRISCSNCFIECYNLCNLVDWGSNDELKSYIPLINSYYAHYYCREKGF